MFCTKCGMEIGDDAVFCPECGTTTRVAPAPVTSAPYSPPPAQPAPERQYAPQPATPPNANYGPAGHGAPQPPYGQPYPPGGYAPREHVADLLIPSILMTICCCGGLTSIAGAIALVFSAYSRTKLQYGDIQGAKDDATKAKIALMVGAGIVILSVLMAMIIAASGGMRTNEIFNHMKDTGRF